MDFNNLVLVRFFKSLTAYLKNTIVYMYSLTLMY